MLIIYNYVIM